MSDTAAQERAITHFQLSGLMIAANPSGDPPRREHQIYVTSLIWMHSSSG